MSLDSPLRARPASSYNRKRAGNACFVCRSRKTKCDNQRPVCGFCAATGGECQYVDSDPSQFDRASLAILQRLSQLESTLISHIDNSFKEHVNAAANSGTLSSHRTRESSTAFQPETNDGSTASWTAEAGISLNPINGQGDVNLLEQKLHENDATSDLLDDMPPSSTVVLQASKLFAESVLKWPIFSQAAPHLETELHVPIMEVWSRSGSNRRQLQHQTRKRGASILNLDSEVVNQLVENFLTNNHIKNPVLDVQSLRADAREFAETGPQWDEKSCLILIVCAVSSLSAPLAHEIEPGRSKDVERLALAEAYFQASQRRIGMLYHQNSLAATQCSFLTAVYLMSTMQILAAWKCFAQAGAQCLAWLTSQGRLKGTDLMHTATAPEKGNEAQPDRNPATSHAEDSLYWSCLKSELELRFELGLPGSGLNEMHYLHLFPSPPLNIQNGMEASSYDAPQIYCLSPRPGISNSDCQNLELGWFFYLAEIALKRMLHNVMTWLYKSKRTNNHGDAQRENDCELERGAAEFDTQIQEWYDALPPPMRFPTQTDHPTGDILRFILRCHMIDIREVARFPAVHAVLASPSPFSTDNFSTTCIHLVQELLKNAVDRIRANREGWYHRHQGTWLMMRSCSRSALHLLGMALKCHQAATAMKMDRQVLEQEVLPPQWKEAVVQVVELLDYWAEESGDIKRLSSILKELMHSYESPQE